MILRLSILSQCVLLSSAHLSATPCETPPENGFLTAQQMDFVCQHRKHWIMESDALKGEIGKTTYKQLSYLSKIEDCTRKNCVKEARRRKRASSKSIRKEIRMTTKEERRLLFEAMNRLKTSMIDNITAWDLHTLVHYPDSAPGAHWGAAFLPWHREFLRQFEIALQREIPSVSLPYWDSTIDQGLPDPADSVLFSDELMGNGNGYVKTGPFSDWDTNVFMPLSQIPVKKLYRSTGGRPQDRLMSPNDVEWIMARKNYSQLTFCHDKTFESIHGLSHVWVGGFMFVIRVSPNDPMFYMHHAFVDNLWEQFRRKGQTRKERETQWATDPCNKLHAFDAQMKPFRIQNRDGLSNKYTDEWYDYEEVRHCTPQRKHCDSKYYWCDVGTWRCKSKVVLGGNCTGYEGQPICHNSICEQGKCRVPPRVMSAMKKRHTVDKPSFDTVWAKTILLDTDGKGLNTDLSKVTVTDEKTGHNLTSYGRKNLSFPEIPGTIYVPLPKPRAGVVRNVTLEARDENGRYCQAHCWNSTVDRYQVCQPNLSIGFRAESSSPISYTHSISSRRYLDVDMSVHPRKIELSVPYIVFACSRKLMTSSMITSSIDNVRPPRNRDQFVWFRVTVHRKATQNLQIEVASQDGRIWSSSVRRASSPFDSNIVFVEAPNPELHPEGVQLHVNIMENRRMAKCTTKCTRKDGSIYNCDGNVMLHNEDEMSDESVFTSNQDELQILGWNMRGHPSEWRHKMPFLSFHCQTHRMYDASS